MGRLPEPKNSSNRRQKEAVLLPSSSSSSPPEETDYRPINWRRLFLRPKYIPLHLLAALILVATVLITVRHDDVVTALRPFSEEVRDLPAGWLIPIAVLILISFPPLFGHEVVAVLCGIVYGLWPGFGVVAAGTFFGEVGTWFAFKHALRRRAVRLERTNLNYGALARMTRDGGFWIVLVIRFSVIPSHFSTAVFSTCDVNFWYFCVATFLTLPKQIILVYLGVLFLNQQTGSVEKGLIFGVGGAATVALGVYVWWKMGAIKKMLLEEQAERRRQREGNGIGTETGSVKSVRVEGAESDTASLVPLRLGEGWDGSPPPRRQAWEAV
ncbi:Golgi apparatus membrane protein TVP38-like protein 2 [Coniochaeta hoffmannii]|uniref:Golgi apparatus membrane protein TVP38 n=1 Tax=Coniochaeta hoffmannii TaxID=91930 RepID=A0AA38S076_9PEZI|nr:Golgi apparatus membrane protein TVP38-like protein 2 [Coniochaeta hoffmannii]